MGHPAIQQFRHDHDTILEHCALIDSRLRTQNTRAALEKLGANIIDFEAAVLRPHLERESHALLHVLRRSQGGHAAVVERADKLIRGVRGSMNALRRVIETGGDLRPAITDTAEQLKEYATYEQQGLLDWAERSLAPELLDEVDRRLAARSQSVKVPAGSPAATEPAPSGATGGVRRPGNRPGAGRSR